MNNCSFVGRTTRDLEIRRTQSGKAVCSFTLAVDRPHVKDVTDFIDFVVWGQGAEYLCKYAKKGTKVSVTGALTSRKWEDKNGNKRTSFEITCDSVAVEDSKNSNTDGNFASYNSSAPTGAPSNAPAQDFAMIEDDDAQLPF